MSESLFKATSDYEAFDYLDEYAELWLVIDTKHKLISWDVASSNWELTGDVIQPYDYQYNIYINYAFTTNSCELDSLINSATDIFNMDGGEYSEDRIKEWLYMIRSEIIDIFR